MSYKRLETVLKLASAKQAILGFSDAEKFIKYLKSSMNGAFGETFKIAYRKGKDFFECTAKDKGGSYVVLFFDFAKATWTIRTYIKAEGKSPVSSNKTGPFDLKTYNKSDNSKSNFAIVLQDFARNYDEALAGKAKF